MVEHVTAGEEEDQDQADSGPQVPVLDDGQNVRVCNGDECEKTEKDGYGRADSRVVDRSADTWVVSSR